MAFWGEWCPGKFAAGWSPLDRSRGLKVVAMLKMSSQPPILTLSVMKKGALQKALNVRIGPEKALPPAR